MEINLVDIFIHIANIVILYVLLRLILYKPVKKFMSERTERIQNQMAEADEAKRVVTKEKELYDKKISQLDASSVDLIKDAEKKAKEKAQIIIAEAEEQAELILLNARRQAQVEAKKTMESMQDQIADAAVEIAGRILNREISVQDNYALVAEYFEQVG